MILRRFMSHVKDQNWFAVGLDVIVVIAGVYVGVFLSEAVKERGVQQDVHTSIEVIKHQLEADLKNLDEIAEYRKNKLEEPIRAIELLSTPNFDKAEFSNLLSSAGSRNFTFFPNISGYGIAEKLGYLTKIEDKNLQQSLTNLFDRIYVRHVVIADESDLTDFYNDVYYNGVYWDAVEGGFVGDEDIARSRIRNSLLDYHDNSSWYVEFLNTIVRPSIVEALARIEVYQAANNNNITE